jgi:hypothetical protein
MFALMRALVLASALSIAAPVAAQNLLANGDFDTSLDGWFNPEPPMPSWDALDVLGASNSGSVRALNNDFAPSQRVALTQCIVPPRPGPYRVFGSGYIPQQLSVGRLQVVYNLGIGTNCLGGSIASGGAVIESSGAWQRVQSPVDFSVPGDEPTSIQVILLSEKMSSGGAFVGHFDQLELIYVDTVHADGFESAESTQ